MKCSATVFSLIPALLVSTSVLSTVQASNLASDNASNSAYNDGWQTGDNGGSGFGAWTLSTTTNDANQNGLIIESSTTNGAAPSGGIDVGGVSWGLYANNGQVADAVRPFTGGIIVVGQTVSVDFDNGFIDKGGTVGIGLQNASGQNLWELYFVGGDNNYTVNDGAGPTATSLGFTADGLHVAFTLTGATTYSANITLNAGGSQTITGSLISQGDQGIAQFRTFNANGGAGSSNTSYINSLEIIPEPTSFVLAALGLAGAGLLIRRKA